MTEEHPSKTILGLFGLLNNQYTEKYYETVGRIASNWALCELIIDGTIWDLASITEEHGACLTAQYIGLNPRLNALIALVRYWGCSKKLLGDLEEFHKAGIGLAEQRNRAVHDPWNFDPKTKQASKITVTARKVLKYEITPTTLEEMEKLHSHIITYMGEFQKLHDRIIAERHAAFLKKHPSQPPASSGHPISPDRDEKEP